MTIWQCTALYFSLECVNSFVLGRGHQSSLSLFFSLCLSRSTKYTFSYLSLSWSPFISEFPRLFVDTGCVGAVLGGGINHMAAAMQNMISCNTSTVTQTRRVCVVAEAAFPETTCATSWNEITCCSCCFHWCNSLFSVWFVFYFPWMSLMQVYCNGGLCWLKLKRFFCFVQFWVVFMRLNVQRNASTCTYDARARRAKSWDTNESRENVKLWLMGCLYGKIYFFIKGINK